MTRREAFIVAMSGYIVDGEALLARCTEPDEADIRERLTAKVACLRRFVAEATDHTDAEWERRYPKPGWWRRMRAVLRRV